MDKEKQLPIPLPKKRCGYHPTAGVQLVVNEPGSRHYGKWICSECNVFISHSSTPKSIKEYNKRKEILLGLAFRWYMHEIELSAEDVELMFDMYALPRLSAYQQTLCDKLYKLAEKTDNNNICPKSPSQSQSQPSND